MIAADSTGVPAIDDLALWALAVGAILGTGVALWKALAALLRAGRRGARAVDDIIGAPARPGTPARPGLLDRISSMERQMCDLDRRVAEQVAPLPERLDELTERVTQIEDQLRPPAAPGTLRRQVDLVARRIGATEEEPDN
ncbi:hypothetical protein GCM10027160_28860 [Streptomyces calidiresistens]|uniref:DUF2746 domain-containing protein n=1 Tax=Streptomyces calidiresistens TaxID=1485586 RepID=A0A7W3T338_9ACTN|nr:hypothetical protein [Streptomyces calidiresistens]MBB0229888.1 hypothetical protein [Streptomyces calidiresistens]